jgi:hypothetical protein
MTATAGGGSGGDIQSREGGGRAWPAAFVTAKPGVASLA